MLYFGLWLPGEMMQLYKNCFSDLDEAGVQARLEKWGGVPRNVLTHAHQRSISNWETELENALATTDPRVIDSVLDIEKVSDGTRLSNRVFLISPLSQLPEGRQLKPADIEFYNFGSIRICSEHAATVVIRSYAQQKQLDARQLLADYSITGGVASMVAGVLLQELSKNSFLFGGKFVIRRLRAAGTSTESQSTAYPSDAELRHLQTVSLLEFRAHFRGLSPGGAQKPLQPLPGTFLLEVPPMAVDGMSPGAPTGFSQASDIHLDTDGKLLQVAVKKNFAAIDYLLGLILCNATLNAKHTIAHDGLLRVWQQLLSRLGANRSVDANAFPYVLLPRHFFNSVFL
jgi:hypothetical protein